MADTGNGVVGAVMVVGGGIAGMQASLDLAEAGFRVYLVEAKSAIGGHMAQLDKTFPTNDCAMCTISPKLVETGRHLNIQVLTDTEVVKVEGEAGRFTATLRRKPRYIDLTKCVGCGDCATVCPITLPSQYDEGLVDRRAVYRLYPQAIPAAYAIEKGGMAPCRNACPINQRAQGYVALVREGRYADAYRTIIEDNPFPSVCGRVCNHHCEDACSRGQWDAPINIMGLKRFVADWARANPDKLKPISPEKAPSTGRKIAIIGAGPAGLTAAYDSVLRGHAVTVFEALPVAGGMMMFGIPEYRLPRDPLFSDIYNIEQAGIQIRCNMALGRDFTIDQLLDRNRFDAVILAIGAHKSRRLGIPGEDKLGVVHGTNFLRDIALDWLKHTTGDDSARSTYDVSGKGVAIVGGGDVAIDAARSAWRLGASQVHVIYRRERQDMPAHVEEIEAAVAEGIQFHFLANPIRVLGEDYVTGVVVQRQRLGELDSSGRRQPVPVEGDEFKLDIDVLIPAIGQVTDLSWMNSDSIETTKASTFVVDEALSTTRPGVFAAGDAVSGPATVVQAIAAGHRVAESVHAYLQSDAQARIHPPSGQRPPKVDLSYAEIAQKIAMGQAAKRGRATFTELPVTQRTDSCVEIKAGLTEEQARAEAERCLTCGICSECNSCVYTCQAGAIVHDMVEREEQIEVGAVILAPGYEAYNAQLSEEFGFGRYANVVTALQFERLLSASGPTAGHVERPSDHRKPERIAFLQCIGSRDQSHDYCSAVCCMYATKQAIMAKEHEPDTDIQVFLMDMRAFSKGYEEYYHRARNKYGVKYTRCRVSALKEDPITRNLIVRYVTDEGAREQGGNGLSPAQIVEESFDLVVLSVGMEMSNSVQQLGRNLGIELDDYGFCSTVQFAPLQTSRPGIFAVGPFVEPKDIPETVVEASGAAAEAAALLARVRGSLVREKEYPPERDVIGEAPRVGVFVCHCGSNIGGYLDVPGVAEYARTLPGVVHAEANLYTCSQDTITHITETIAALRLNRMVVASCTPRTHEPLFQDSLRAAGLNPFLFEMANIRNQCSWVHSHDWDGATRKARELVRMSVARVLRQEPLHKIDLPLEKTALVIGGGVAGLTAARSLAEQGFPVHLVERRAELGGNLRQVYYTVESSRLKVESYQGNQPFGLSLRACPERSEGAKPSTLRAEPQGEAFNLQPETSDPQAFLAELIDAVEHQPLITVHLETDLVDTKGFVGNFTSLLRKHRTGVSSDRLKVEGSNLQPSTLRAEPQGEAFNLQPSTHELLTVQHGATIVATGGQEWHGDAYLLGQDARVMTQGDFEAWLAAQREPGSKGAEEQRSRGAEERKRMHFCTSAPRHLGSSGARLPIVARSVVMIQCVGPAERYCGRICCTTALKNALKIKELSPTTQVTVLYKDIRTYGFKERLYTEARRAGVVFIRYDDEHRPEVRVEGTSDDGQLALSGAKRRTTDSRLSTLSVKVWEPILGQELTLQPDLLILSTPIVPSAGAHEVGRILKVPVDLDGWFLEAHPKLRPVDFASDGVFMAGLAHYPKLLGESIAQAQAAAARAATILSKPVLSVGGVVAQVDQDQCTGCLTCVRACPYQVPKINPAAVGVGGILGAAEIQPAQCQGCGVCVAECPAKAIQLMHYTDAQVCAKIDAVFVPAGFVPLAAIG